MTAGKSERAGAVFRYTSKSARLAHFRAVIHFPSVKSGIAIGRLPAAIEASLRAIRSGVAVATVKGRDLIPQADLALSQAFRQDAFQQVELAKDQALQYLRCEALHLPDAPKGFHTVTCEDLPLGFVKNLGNRANNLFPQAWRLRMNC